MSIETDVDHWTIKVRPNETVHFNEYNAASEKSTHLHVTQAALGLNPKAGRHVVLAGKGVIGSLELGRCEHFPLDLIFTSDTTFTVVGPSEAHLSGYTTTSTLFGAEDGPSDDEEVPAGVPVRHPLLFLPMCSILVPLNRVWLPHTARMYIEDLAELWSHSKMTSAAV